MLGVTSLLNQRGMAESAATTAAAGSQEITDIQASAFEGTFSDVLPSIVRGGIRVEGALRTLADTAWMQDQYRYEGTDEDLKTKSETLFGNTEQDIKRRGDTITSLMPDPRSVGFAGRVLGAVTEAVPTIAEGIILTPAYGPAAMPAAFATTYGISETERMMSEGVDRDTARRAGVVTGLFAGVGTAVPAALVGGALKRAASGALINTSVNAAGRATIGETLRNAGYADMAKQYEALDATALISDMLLGAGFGVGLGSRATLPSHIDAAKVGADALNAEIDSAPGIPTTPKTRADHLKALEIATEQLQKGERVEIPEHLTNGDFIPHRQEIGAVDKLIATYRSMDMHAEADALQKMFNTTKQAVLRREGKLVEVEGKIATARAEASAASAEAERLRAEVAREPTPQERIGIVDPATAERLAVIENELLDLAISSGRKADLEHELTMLVDGSRYDQATIEGTLTARKQKLMDDMAAAENLKLKKEADAIRYETEAAKRREKLGITEPTAEMPRAPESTMREGMPPAKDAPSEKKTEPLQDPQKTAEELGDDPLADLEKIDPDSSIVTDDGRVITAKEAMEEIKNDMIEADEADSVFGAAIKCFLRG